LSATLDFLEVGEIRNGWTWLAVALLGKKSKNDNICRVISVFAEFQPALYGAFLG
jgi:hypothetical protein